MHPVDCTVRPHIVSKAENTDYYQLLHLIKNAVGVGCVLNTSLNLHNNPILDSPNELLNLILNSKIDGILLEDSYVFRKV